MEKESGMSAQHGLFSVILPPPPLPLFPPGVSKGPAVLGRTRAESAAASSRNWGPGPHRTLQGILAAIPRMAKELVQ